MQADADVTGPDSGDELGSQLEFDNDFSEDDEGGTLENLEMDDEGPVVPIPANSIHTADAQPPTATADHDPEPPDAQADCEELESSSSAGTSITISTTGPRITPPSNQNVYIEQFPGSFAGMPVVTAGSEPVYIHYASQLGTPNDPWAPFASKLDGKSRDGLSSGDLDQRLLQIWSRLMVCVFSNVYCSYSSKTNHTVAGSAWPVVQKFTGIE